jgi:hypothetical protein
LYDSKNHKKLCFENTPRDESKNILYINVYFYLSALSVLQASLFDLDSNKLRKLGCLVISSWTWAIASLSHKLCKSRFSSNLPLTVYMIYTSSIVHLEAFAFWPGNPWIFAPVSARSEEYCSSCCNGGDERSRVGMKERGSRVREGKVQGSRVAEQRDRRRVTTIFVWIWEAKLCCIIEVLAAFRHVCLLDQQNVFTEVVLNMTRMDFVL